MVKITENQVKEISDIFLKDERYARLIKKYDLLPGISSVDVIDKKLAQETGDACLILYSRKGNSAEARRELKSLLTEGYSGIRVYYNHIGKVSLA